jgi:hypothetical protein
VTIDGAAVETWIVPREAAGQPFVRFVRLPRGVPEGPGSYATLRVAARSLEPGRPVPEIAIRQFDLQSDGGRPLMAFADGWYEDEYSPETGQRWRWTGAGAQLRLVSSRTVVLQIRGESPVKYVGVAPTVRIAAGGRTLGHVSPARRLHVAHHGAHRCADRSARRGHGRNRSHVSARSCRRHGRHAEAWAPCVRMSR